MPKKNKGHVRSGQKDRADENNEKAIRELLADADAAKKEWLAKPKEWREANHFIPDPSLGVVRILAWPSTEWYTIETPGGRMIQVRALNMGLADLLSKLCKQCRQSQADSGTWPMVIVSLPKPSASSQTGEILAILDQDEVSQFADLGFKVTGGKALDDLFDRSDAAGGGGGEIDLDDI